MQAFVTFSGIIAPLDRPNIGTDAIIPKQFLKSIKRSGFGPNLFDGWRYLDEADLTNDDQQRQINPDFILNQSPFDKAEILLARENFGCGSSREHAVWALTNFGFRAVLASCFADIFYSNSFKNGFLPVCLEEQEIDALFASVSKTPGQIATVDLENQTVSMPEGLRYSFSIEANLKERLLKGLDDIGLTLQMADKIRDYEQRRATKAPWLFPEHHR